MSLQMPCLTQDKTVINLKLGLSDKGKRPQSLLKDTRILSLVEMEQDLVNPREAYPELNH